MKPSQPFFNPHPDKAVASTGVATSILTDDTRSMSIPVMLGASLILHLLLIGLTGTTMMILSFLGFDFTSFDLLDLKERDVTFVLVDRPEAQPRNKNTKNRADRATRSGGKKVANLPEAETQRAAGQGTPSKPSPPTVQANQPKARPQPKPQPRRPQPKPQPVAKRRPQPQPKPRPRTAPKAPVKPIKIAKAPTLPPSPTAPTIKLPSAPSPKKIATGPLFTSSTAAGKKGGRSSGSPSPSQVPGSVSGGRSGQPSRGMGRPGSRGGSGGSGAYNQSGSPGGGGGAPGIDALPEPDFGPYIAELQRRIKRNWMPPSDDKDKRVVAVFTIARDGRLLKIRLQQSSGAKTADAAAVAAINASAPFRPLPYNYRGKDIDVQFIFDYTVHNGGRLSRR